jgi:hypothetical protein
VEFGGVSSIPIALHPPHQGADDSGLVLTEPPNRNGLNSPLRFRRNLPAPFTRDPKLLGTAHELLMAAAPLPEALRISDCGEESQMKGRE